MFFIYKKQNKKILKAYRYFGALVNYLCNDKKENKDIYIYTGKLQPTDFYCYIDNQGIINPLPPTD